MEARTSGTTNSSINAGQTLMQMLYIAPYILSIWTHSFNIMRISTRDLGTSVEDVCCSSSASGHQQVQYYSSNSYTIYIVSQTVAVSSRMISQLKQTQSGCSVQGLCMHITTNVCTKSTFNITNGTVCHSRSN